MSPQVAWQHPLHGRCMATTLERMESLPQVKLSSQSQVNESQAEVLIHMTLLHTHIVALHEVGGAPAQRLPTRALIPSSAGRSLPNFCNPSTSCPQTPPTAQPPAESHPRHPRPPRRLATHCAAPAADPSLVAAGLGAQLILLNYALPLFRSC